MENPIQLFIIANLIAMIISFFWGVPGITIFLFGLLLELPILKVFIN